MVTMIDSSSSRDQLAAYIVRLCRVHGTFRLRSGHKSETYFDKYLFESDPAVLSAIATHLADMIPTGTQVLAGLELGGVPLATAVSLHTGLPAAFVRKHQKEYGTCKLAEGADVNDRATLIIEDVISTGGQVVTSANQLRAHGALVEAVLCVIDRRPRNAALLEDAQIRVLSLLSKNDLDIR